jgi:hypothetical protein
VADAVPRDAGWRGLNGLDGSNDRTTTARRPHDDRNDDRNDRNDRNAPVRTQSRRAIRIPTPSPATNRRSSATRFPVPRDAQKVAHACQTAPIRENTDPPTTGNP